MRRFAGIGKPCENLSRFPKERGVRRPQSSHERVDQTVPSSPPIRGVMATVNPAILPRQPAWPRSTQAPGGAEMTGLVLENLAECSEHPGKITELYETRAM